MATKTLIIQGPLERIFGCWTAGYLDPSGAVKIFGGGVDSQTLQQVIAGERRRFEGLQIDDRRR